MRATRAVLLASAATVVGVLVGCSATDSTSPGADASDASGAVPAATAAGSEPSPPEATFDQRLHLYALDPIFRVETAPGRARVVPVDPDSELRIRHANVEVFRGKPSDLPKGEWIHLSPGLWTVDVDGSQAAIWVYR